MSSEIDLRKLAPALVNPACPAADVYSGGQPTAEELRRLAESGIRTVLDLRAPDEPRGFDQAEATRAAGLEYVVLPVTAQTLTHETFDRFRDLMRAREKRPVLVHCRSGNRVGAFLMPYLILDEGLDPDAALQVALEVGLRSQNLLDIAMAYTREAAADSKATPT